MKIKIREHFEEAIKKQQELITKVESESEHIAKQISLKTEEKLKLEAEKKKKETLLRPSEEEGMDVSKLKEKIQELDLMVVKLANEIQKLEEEQQNIKPVVAREFEREGLLVSLLENVCDCPEADVFENLHDLTASLLSEFPVKVTEHDSAGRPLVCELPIVGYRKLTIKIKPSDKHFLLGFRPKALEWLPALKPNKVGTEKPQDITNREFSAFILKDSDRLLLTKTKISWTTRSSKMTRDYPQGVIENKHDDFADLAGCWPDLLEEVVKSTCEELDLNKKHGENELLYLIQKRIVALTDPEPSFKECKERLASQEIYQRIKVDWDAFSACPWSADITGRLALLKFYVENGERARFWSTEFDGHYGFRLRSRDHDWIVGNIFILSSEKSATQNSIIEVITRGEGYDEYHSPIVKLGRMLLRCWHG